MTAADCENCGHPGDAHANATDRLPIRDESATGRKVVHLGPCRATIHDKRSEPDRWGVYTPRRFSYPCPCVNGVSVATDA